jgi:hypothetical protein
VPNYGDFTPERIKHLELIQTVVERLVTLEFFVKGWALTVVGVALGFAVKKERPGLVLASLGSTLLFGAYEWYLLRTERQFRALFDHVAGLDDRLGPFFMRATKDEFKENLTEREKEETAPGTVLFLRSIFWFYLALVVLTVLAVPVIDHTFRHDSPGLCQNAVQALAESAALENKALVGVSRAVLDRDSASLRRADDLTHQADESVGKAEALATACSGASPSPTLSPS